MKKINHLYFTIIMFLFAFYVVSPARAKINVVASVPDLADMARIIGGDKVRVTVLASGREDLHAVPARPSFIIKLNRADILLTLGLQAEHSWLNALAKEARNRKIAPDGEGWIEVYKGLRILQKPRILDRAEGHQHPLGNPHYNIGPQSGPIMARNIAKTFIDYDPENKDYYQSNLNVYLQQIHTLLNELKEKGKVLQGISVVAHHADIIYLTDFYGMKKVATIEPKPGIQPGAQYLAKLRRIIKNKKVLLILYNQAQNPSISQSLARHTGAKSVEFANLVGAKSEIKTWIDLQRYNLQQLLKALGK